MEFLTDLFSHVCGQRDCFVVDAAPLPVCPRCFGLYIGATITAIWLLGSGVWRRGLPTRSVVLVQALMLLTAMLGGTHTIPGGATWRLLCGLWTGHVVLVWLASGAHLWLLSHPCKTPPGPWRTQDKLQAFAAPALLAGFAFTSALWLPAGWYFWTGIIVIGAMSLLAALAVACVSAVVWLVAGLRRQPACPEPSCTW